MSFLDDEPPGEHRGGGDVGQNVAESVTTITSSEDGTEDGKMSSLRNKKYQ